MMLRNVEKFDDSTCDGELRETRMEPRETRVEESCMRFHPEPSGFLHIGHAKVALLNHYFVRTDRNGKLIIRFDDSNPSKDTGDFAESILEDLETLGVKGDMLTYTSDYFDQLQDMAEKLIREGKAYMDDTPEERMREERRIGTVSKRRDQSVEENLALWKELLVGSERGQTCCLRGKLDMQALNETLRDPVYYRCNLTSHHRVGTKYKAFPTYDFACPCVDSVEGVTHALTSHHRADQYYRILEDTGLKRVVVCDFKRLHRVYRGLSRLKLKWFVENSLVEVWDDPRFPTVRGIQRDGHGLTVEALKQFISSLGPSKNLTLMEWDKSWTINKKVIDPICPLHTAVLTDGKVLLDLSNGPRTPCTREIPGDKKFDGARKDTYFTRRIWLDQADALTISPGQEVTLMDWRNAIVKPIEKNSDGKVIGLSGDLGDLHLTGSVKTSQLKLTWLPESSELVSRSLVDLDHPITKPKFVEGKDHTSLVLNARTRWKVAAIGDSNMRNLKKDEIIQLERKGYFICEIPYCRSSEPIVLIAIPDGRQRTPPAGL